MIAKIIAMALACISICAIASNECNYDMQSGCSKDQRCILFPPKTARCFPVLTSELKVVMLPFESSKPIVCDQGNLSPSTESHSYINTAYALDLKPSSFFGDVILKAGISGKAIVFNECHTENDSCGLGFGNHIKILSDDGFMLLYAHMKKIDVKTGDFIKEGQVVGSMGMTGATGVNNPHLHVSMHYDWKQGSSFDYWKQTGYVPNSVPFKIKSCRKGCSGKCSFVEIASTEIQCFRTRPKSTELCIS
jgi:Peptidase family M23